MPLSIPFRNPLAYPAGVAMGIDLSHPAAGATLWSIAATGNGLISVLQGTRRTGTVAPSYAPSIIGPAGLFSGGNVDQFSNVPFAAGVTTFTIAAIILPTSLTGNTNVFNYGSGGTGVGILSVSGALRVDYPGVGNVTSGISMTNNVPQAVFISRNAVPNTNFVIANLQTGQVITATSGSATAGVAPATRLDIGNGGFGFWTGYIACCMFSARYLSMPELLKWAADPWSFWYPRRPSYNVAAAAAGGAFPWWAVDNNLGVIGAGTY